MRTYRQYLGSAHWRAVRARWTAKACFTCGEERGLSLHHCTYVRLGAEREDDVRTLCESCHVMVHRSCTKTESLYPPTNLAAAARTHYSALTVACPVCGVREGVFCHTRSGRPLEIEHKQRRQLADQRGREKAAQRRRRRRKKDARKRRLTEAHAQAIDRARAAEFPLDALRAELDAEMDRALERD